MIDDKTITEDDILEFQLKSFGLGKSLSYLEQLTESEVKVCLKDIEAKY